MSGIAKETLMSQSQSQSQSTVKKADPRDYKSNLKPIWCPGCGDFGVLSAIYKSLAATGRAPHEIAFISGIGCSGRISGYTSTYGFNSVHGRALPIAQGVKLANPDLLVLVAGGDGDGFSIGGGHIAHIARRNINITYLVMDNLIYGLTKGQLSPTSKEGLVSPTSPHGSLEAPVNPIQYVLAYGTKFVAQGTPADLPGLVDLILKGINFPGFAFINIHSPCVTFGQNEDQIAYQKKHIHKLSDVGHDPADRFGAMRLADERESKLYTGIFYEEPETGPDMQALIEERQAMVGEHDANQILDGFRVYRN